MKETANEKSSEKKNKTGTDRFQDCCKNRSLSLGLMFYFVINSKVLKVFEFEISYKYEKYLKLCNKKL